MTAFAHHRAEHSWGTLTWELRSVNHRYLDLQFKLPELWRGVEPALREALRQQLARGKVECALRVHSENSADTTLELNEALAQQLIAAAQQLQQRIDGAAALDPLQLLQWPGVLSQSEVDSDAVQSAILAAFSEALAELGATREREGSELRAFIEQRLQQIATITAELRQRMPEIVAAQRHKLQQRLADLQVQLDAERLEAEVALLAQKLDVDEELDRLQTHVAEVKRVLAKGGACGRRLDFLMQELNREANTLSSKAVVSDSTAAAVELKVLIEQMREQIQNLE